MSLSGTVRSFKLKESCSVFTGPGDRPPSKLITYVNTELDKGAWRGWEFEAGAIGILITPPWKGDSVLAPWTNVVYVQMRPAAPAPKSSDETKKANK